MKKIVKKYQLGKEPKDGEYWLSQPPAERIAEVERIRQEYHQWKYHAEPRLQRVYHVIKQT